MKLTDRDRIAIGSALTSVSETDYYTAGIEAVYLAGLRAGMERAAKLCDEWDARGVGPAIREAAKD